MRGDTEQLVSRPPPPEVPRASRVAALDGLVASFRGPRRARGDEVLFFLYLKSL